MNIDYSTIITKANDRKELLQKLAELLNEADKASRSLAFVQQWARTVNDVYKTLDNEGKALVPSVERQALEYMHSSCTRLDLAQLDGHSGISKLIQN